MIPRWLHRVYAWFAGYGWGPCPICGREFGGHQWRDRAGKSSTISTGATAGRAICPTCTREGKGDPRWAS